MNYTELNRIIDESGMKRHFIAQQLGMSDQTFYNKTRGKSPWRYEEAQAFSELFNLPKRERREIFFP